MKQEIIDKLNLKEVPGYWFGQSFLHNIKTYLFNNGESFIYSSGKFLFNTSIYCALAEADGTPSEKGDISFWIPKVGSIKISEEFILNNTLNDIKVILVTLNSGKSGDVRDEIKNNKL